MKGLQGFIFQNMVMADSEVGICLDGVDGDEEFDMNNPHFWDHPEHVSLDELVKDWNSNVDCFDPIPMADILIETPTMNCCKIENFVRNFHFHIDDMPTVTPTMHCRKMEVCTPKFQVHSDGIYEPKQLPNSVGFSPGGFNVEDSSNTSVINQKKFSEIQVPGVFQTQSPVSVLESSGSCSTGNFSNVPGQPRSTQSPISVLESSGACSSANSRTIPGQPRSKNIRKPSHVKPWYVISPSFATKSASERKSNAKKNKERRKKLSQLSVTEKTMKDISQNDLMLRSVVTKKCTHCEITKTPQWREGPMGPKTLCNACGVRYRSGRLFPEYRPAASPTFVPALHSNSHKKVVEMRNKAKSHEPTFEEPLISLGEMILQVTVS